jgi:hypothetical protein
MELPNRENAYIPPAKLYDCLLSETHPAGGAKARFLIAAGFNQTNVDVLEQGLITIGQSQEVTEVIPTRYGIKYIIGGVLQTPTGEPLRMRTVWFVDIAQDNPRLVTAYPA